MTIVFEAIDTDTLTLPNPRLGNSRHYNLGTIFKTAMDGSIHSHIKTPVTRKLLLIFDALTAANVSAIITFFQEHLHETLTFTNWETVIYSGNIINNPIEMIQPNRGFYSMVIEFEGTES